MTFNVINGELFEFREIIKDGDKEYFTISYGKLLDYELENDILLKEVKVKQVIEIEKYLRGETYLSVERVFVSPFPLGVKPWINGIRKLNQISPITD